jgi:acyl-coenzyme A thioesterase PaaI-like protein
MSADPSVGEEFPPLHYVSRDMGIAYRFTSPESAEVHVPVTPFLVGADGAVRSEVLLNVFDEVSGFLAVMPVLPDWVATADFQFGVDPVPAGDTVEFRARILKTGKRLVIVESEAWTGGARAGWAAAGFSRVPRSGSNASFEMPELDTSVVYDLAVEGSGFKADYPEALGIETIDGPAGVLQLAFSDYISNSAHIAHGGVAGGVALLAAETASGGSATWRATDAHFHYLAPGRVGPFRTTAEPLVAHAERQVWRVQLTDTGDDDRLMTVVSVTTLPVANEG